MRRARHAVRKNWRTYAPLVLPALVLLALGTLEWHGRNGLVSHEVTFTDPSAGGLAIMPASCSSNPSQFHANLPQIGGGKGGSGASSVGVGSPGEIPGGGGGGAFETGNGGGGGGSGAYVEDAFTSGELTVGSNIAVTIGGGGAGGDANYDGGAGARGECRVTWTGGSGGEQTFTSSGTFTVPSYTTLLVRCWGGGGGGRGDDAGGAAGNGGETIFAVLPFLRAKGGVGASSSSGAAGGVASGGDMNTNGYSGGNGSAGVGGRGAPSPGGTDFGSYSGQTEFGATKHGVSVCVTNTSGLNYFVPGGSAAELNAFKSAAGPIPNLDAW